MAVHELLPVTPEISKMIAQMAPAEEIREVAVNYGYEPMQVDAMHRVLDGQTSVSEAKRVLAFNTFAARNSPVRLAA